MTVSHANVWPIFLLVLLFIPAGCGPESTSSSNAGFAGLATRLAGDQNDQPDRPFRQPEPGDTIVLPRDLGPHPQYRIEWWYLTANLHTPDGQPLGLQWTQFRQALQARAPDKPPPPPSDWPLQSVWMADAALSFQGEHRFEEKLARGDIGQAGAQASPFAVWLDDWQLSTDSQGRWHLRVATGDWRYQLTLERQSPAVRHGDQGFSAKSPDGEGSMYFSYVDLRISGTVSVGNQSWPVAGEGWFDREWSSQFLKTGQQGWDWMGLHLASGAEVMAFRLRSGEQEFRSGTWISPTGDVTSLKTDELSLVPVGFRDTGQGRVPDRWRLEIPSKDLTYTVSAVPGVFWNQGLYPYWESPVRVSGSETGEGYIELTGYRGSSD